MKTKRRLGPPPKEAISIRLSQPTLTYFRELSQRLGVPYQTLINECVNEAVAKKWTVNALEPNSDTAVGGEDGEVA